MCDQHACVAFFSLPWKHFERKMEYVVISGLYLKLTTSDEYCIILLNINPSCYANCNDEYFTGLPVMRPVDMPMVEIFFRSGLDPNFGGWPMKAKIHLSDQLDSRVLIDIISKPRLRPDLCVTHRLKMFTYTMKSWSQERRKDV